MRVAIVQETIDAQRGGAETSTLEMARHLGLLGLEVTILCRAASGDCPTLDNLRIRPVPVGGFSKALRTYRFVQSVQRLCRRERFDIIHAVTPCLAADVYQPRGGTYAETVERSLAMVAPPALRELKWLGRHFNLRQRFLLRLEEMLLRKRRHRVVVAALSDYVRRQVVSGYDFPAERVRVMFNGVDIEPLSDEQATRERAALREKLGVSPDMPLVLFAAHNFKLKGLAELIRASAASAADWMLVVAGRDRPGRWQALARRLGVTERVRFVGTEKSIRGWYAAADLLAHPTWYDPCSRVVLEALSVGLPVVTTRFNGAAEVMEPGRHGEIVASPVDIEALAAAIARALCSETRDACHADAPRLRERLSMARHARELKALYVEIAGGRD